MVGSEPYKGWLIADPVAHPILLLDLRSRVGPRYDAARVHRQNLPGHVQR